MGIKEYVYTQFEELIKKYPSLMLCWQDNIGIIEGELCFTASFNQITIEDSYNIRMEIPTNYPNELPLIKEIGNRIPANFHKNGDDILCLEVNTRIQIEFMKNPTLLFFVEKFVIEYLYGFSYKTKFGNLPYGERPHGTPGIIDFYKELFNITNITSIFNFLKILSNNNYRGHHLCPCKSGKKLRDCHGKIIMELSNLNIHNSFNNDLITIKEYINS